MLVNMEDDADNLAYQMFQSLYQAVNTVQSQVPATFQDRRFQGFLLAVVLFQLYLALGPLSQDISHEGVLQP